MTASRVCLLIVLLTALCGVYADEQQHHHPAEYDTGFQQQPAFRPPQRPFRSHPQRRQSTLSRTRSSIMSFFRDVMASGARLRRTASNRFNQFNNAISRRFYGPVARRDTFYQQY